MHVCCSELLLFPELPPLQAYADQPVARCVPATTEGVDCRTTMQGDPLDKCHKLVWRNCGVRVSRTPEICSVPTIEWKSETRKPPVAAETRKPPMASETRSPQWPRKPGSRCHREGHSRTGSRSPSGLGNPEAPSGLGYPGAAVIGRGMGDPGAAVIAMAPGIPESPSGLGNPEAHSGLGNPGAAVIGRDPGAAVIAMASHEAARKDWSASVATRSGPASTVAEV